MRILRAIVAAMLVGGILFGVQTPAQASGCNIFNTDDGGPFGTGMIDGQIVTWTPTYVVPGWSSCHDLQVRNLIPYDCDEPFQVYVRLRFYPSNAPAYAQTQWTITPCFSSTWKIIGTNLANGSHVRLELLGYEPTSMDVMD